MAKPKDESPFAEIQHPKKRAYLRALVEAGGNVTRACEIAEIDRSTPYSDQWAGDEGFQQALQLARAMAADHLEAEAVRRAYEGVEKPVGFYKGEASAYVREYSDTLLIFLLNGLKPDRYVHRVEHSGPGGGPIEHVDVTEARQKLEDEMDRLAERLKERGASPSPN